MVIVLVECDRSFDMPGLNEVTVWLSQQALNCLFMCANVIGRFAGFCPEKKEPREFDHLFSRLTAVACHILLLLFSFNSAAASPETKRVLVVHSFGSAAPPFTTHSIAFETELTEKMGHQVDLDEVSLDMARYADEEMQEALVEYMQKRQAKWQPDLVVPIGSPAGVFVAQSRDRLFP